MLLAYSRVFLRCISLLLLLRCLRTQAEAAAVTVRKLLTCMQTWRQYIEDCKLVRRTFTAWAHTTAAAQQSVDELLSSTSTTASTTAAPSDASPAATTATTTAVVVSAAAAVQAPLSATAVAVDAAAAAAAAVAAAPAVGAVTVPVDADTTSVLRQMLHAWRAYTVAQRVETLKGGVLSQHQA
jgi:hypothetical protein